MKKLRVTCWRLPLPTKWLIRLRLKLTWQGIRASLVRFRRKALNKDCYDTIWCTENYVRDFPFLARKSVARIWFIWIMQPPAKSRRRLLTASVHLYSHDYANVHRGVHTLSVRSTDKFEGARTKVKDFINAASEKEIIFVKGATEAINLVAQTYGKAISSRVMKLSLPPWSIIPILCLANSVWANRRGIKGCTHWLARRIDIWRVWKTYQW